jgi:hypothetical protein
MKLRITVLAAAFAAAVSAPALANQCPADIKKIDAAMAGAKLSQEQITEVSRLRDEGQRLHSEGKHQESMAALAKAKALLGVM